MSERHILLANVFFAPFSYGGATIVAEQVAHALIRHGGFRITAVSLCSRHDLAPYSVIKSQKDGITNYLINVPPGRSYGEMYDNPEVTARLAELMATLTPDLVHVHCIQDMGTGIIDVAHAADVPVVLSVHDFWWICERQFMIRVDQKYCGQHPVQIENCKGCVENFYAAKVRQARLKQAGAKVACVTYPSQFALDLSERSDFAKDKGVVWENGVRLPGTDFFEKQAQRRKEDKQLTFGFVGGPSQIKGWPLIRKAFARVENDDFKVLVVDGSLDGSWWADHDFSKLPGDWQVRPRFTQDSMDDFYAEIDVLLFMSQWKETFGLAIREALARGIKVIQTDSGGTTEHGATRADELIPIGAPAEVLRAQLESTLSARFLQRRPHAVVSFDQQAAAFAKLSQRVLKRKNVLTKITNRLRLNHQG